MDRRRKRVTYRPSKGESVFAGIVGVIFVLIGLFVVVPAFGPFGILWTLLAGGIAGLHLYRAFGDKYIGPEIRIEDEEGTDPAGETPADAPPPAAPQPSAEDRLRRLEDLREKRLITANEFEEKRKEILKEL